MKMHVLAVVMALLTAGAVITVIPAQGRGSSRLAKQCPRAAAWLHARDHRARAQKRALEAIQPTDRALARQLAERATRDRVVRNKAVNALGSSRTEALKRMEAVDKTNLAWLKPRVEAHGFPTPKQVGLKGVENAWLLVQHADRDPDFQAQVLSELMPRPRTEPFLRPEFAMLTDRVRLNHLHKKQIYGTQCVIHQGR